MSTARRAERANEAEAQRGEITQKLGVSITAITSGPVPRRELLEDVIRCYRMTVRDRAEELLSSAMSLMISRVLPWSDVSYIQRL